MMNANYFNNLELLRVAKDTAEQKGLSVETIIKALEEAILLASRKKYGNCRLRVRIDRKTALVSIYRELFVVSDGEQPFCGDSEDLKGYKFISLSDALLQKKDAAVGDVMLEQLPPIDVDYNSIRVIKNKVENIIRTEERNKQYEEYKKHVGELIYGIVKRIDYNSIIVDLNGNEALLPVSNLIKGEVFRSSDKIKVYVEDVRREDFGSQIFLSRINKGFLQRLLEQEIPEIYDGIVKIMAVARDPGSRSKVAVFSNDKNIDPVGACVGPRGVRIQSIISELSGEKIDVVAYSSELGKFVVDAIAPAEVIKVIIDEEKDKIELIVPESQMSLAIGRYGQNIKLASELVEWKIDVLSDESESNRKTKELNTGAKLFADCLNVEEIIGQLLFTEGFTTIEDVDRAELSEIEAIEGFDEELASALKIRASEYLSELQNDKIEQLKEFSIDDEILNLLYLNIDDAISLAKSGIKTIEDIAELSTDEFYEKNPKILLSRDEVDSIILECRKKMGWL